MRLCWQTLPQDRPSFSTLRSVLEAMLEEDSGLDYFNYQLEGNSIYYEVNHSNETPAEVTTSGDIRIESESESRLAKDNHITFSKSVDYIDPIVSSSDTDDESENAVCTAEIVKEDLSSASPNSQHINSDITNCPEKAENILTTQEDNYAGLDCCCENLNRKNTASETSDQSPASSRADDKEFDADDSSLNSETSGRRLTDSSSNGDDDVFLADDESEEVAQPTKSHIRNRHSKFNLRPLSKELWAGKFENIRDHSAVKYSTSVASDQNDSGVSTSSVHEGTMYNFTVDQSLNMRPRSRVWSDGEPPVVRATCTETSSCCDSDHNSLNTYL